MELTLTSAYWFLNIPISLNLHKDLGKEDPFAEETETRLSEQLAPKGKAEFQPKSV